MFDLWKIEVRNYKVSSAFLSIGNVFVICEKGAFLSVSETLSHRHKYEGLKLEVK